MADKRVQASAGADDEPGAVLLATSSARVSVKPDGVRDVHARAVAPRDYLISIRSTKHKSRRLSCCKSICVVFVFNSIALVAAPRPMPGTHLLALLCGMVRAILSDRTQRSTAKW